MKAFENSTQRVTMRDIARVCGVSPSAVSYILNDRWREKGLCPETRQRVLDAARKLNYRRNGIARRLQERRTRLVGFVLPYILGSFMSELTFGLESEAAKRGYNVILCHSHNRRDREAREIELLLDLCVDGLIVVPAYDAPAGAVYAELARQGIPLVFMDSRLPDVPAGFAATDDMLGGRMAARHVLELGHREIAHLAGFQVPGLSTYSRTQGFRAALRDAGVALPEARITSLHVNDYPRARAAVTDWLLHDGAISAIFAASDVLAAAALDAARALGRHVPTELTIVGYGDLKGVANAGYRITSLRQPTLSIGKAAVEVLIDAIEAGGPTAVARLVKPELVIRDTCGGTPTPEANPPPFWPGPAMASNDLPFPLQRPSDRMAHLPETKPPTKEKS